ncbi:unnamed protein product [Calicophoron daubneyi]|uniref:Uncharacterized protein n=1 Tax=Calicophoron daubneyi TaxID=300641 RepID=A0AAV2T4B5_CALDB
MNSRNSLSTRGKQRIEDYLKKIKNDADSTELGCTNQGLESELRKQFTLKDALKNVANSPARSKQEVRETMHEISVAVRTNKECLQYLSTLASLEEFYSGLVSANANRVLELVSNRRSARFWKKILPTHIKQNWDRLQTYSDLVGLHLRTVADFHQKQLEYLNYLAGSACRILERSSTIVPIYDRLYPPKSPQKGIMLCDFKTPWFTISAGEQIIVSAGRLDRDNSNSRLEAYPLSTVEESPWSDLADGDDEVDQDSEVTLAARCSFQRTTPNHVLPMSSQEDSFTRSDRLHWCVCSVSQKTKALVPSICVWLFVPDTQARERSSMLNDAVLDAWKDIIFKMQRGAVLFHKIVLKKWCSFQGIHTEDSRSFDELLRQMTEHLLKPLSSETGSMDQSFAKLIGKTRRLWNHTPKNDIGREASTVCYVSREETCALLRMITSIKIHIQARRNQAKRFNSWKYNPTALREIGTRFIQAAESVRIMKKLCLKDPERAASLFSQLKQWEKEDEKQTARRPPSPIFSEIDGQSYSSYRNSASKLSSSYTDLLSEWYFTNEYPMMD